MQYHCRPIREIFIETVCHETDKIQRRNRQFKRIVRIYSYKFTTLMPVHRTVKRSIQRDSVYMVFVGFGKIKAQRRLVNPLAWSVSAAADCRLKSRSRLVVSFTIYRHADSHMGDQSLIFTRSCFSSPNPIVPGSFENQNKIQIIKLDHQSM